MKIKDCLFHPVTLTALVTIVLVGVTLLLADGDPLALARLGTRYSQGDPNGSEGYDGQFVYYIARDLAPLAVEPFLDAPAYRYQRILLPLLVYFLSLGSQTLLPWMLIFIGVVAQVVGTWAVAKMMTCRGVSRWYALAYGLWAGLLLSVVTDMTEPLAYALVALGLLAFSQDRRWLGYLLLGLAVFAKEVTLVFLGACLLDELIHKRWRQAAVLTAIGLIPFGLFQVWLWQVFGQPGLGSGGAMATPFEFIPFMGLLRIGAHSVPYLIAMLVVFGPAIILPSIWGVWKSVQFWRAGERNVVVLALLLNSLVIFFLPFSTFRETGGILRLGCGLVLSVLVFAAWYRQKRVLNYTLFWIVLMVFLFKSQG
ncbi:MAG: hypothetical protein JXB15_05520 [Anaerolineales bacterium]|nr:hypothetical protein [Anaerolineales bacterium]